MGDIDVSVMTKQGLYWSTTLRIVFEAIRFGISIAIARILEPTDFGIVAIGSMIIYYSNSLSDFGLNNGIVQHKELSKIQINSVFTLNFSISVFLTILALTLAKPLSYYFNSPESVEVIVALSSIFLIRTFYDISSALLRRNIQFKLIAKINFFQSLLQSLMALLFAIIGFRYWSLVWSNIFSILLSTIFLMANSSWRPHFNYSNQAMKSFYEFGFWNFLRSQLYFFNNYMPQFFIGRSMGPTNLGFYEKAYSISRIPLDGLMQPINTVLFSTFSRLQDNKVQLANWVENMLIIQGVLVMPLLAGMFSIAPHFIIVLLGEKWRFSIQPLQLLCIAGIFSSFTGGIASFNVAVGIYRAHTYVNALGTAFMVSLSLYTLKWGVSGIAFSYLAATIVWFFLSFRLAATFLKTSVWFILKSFPPNALKSLFMVFIVRWAASGFCSEKSILNLFLLIFIGIICFCVIHIMGNLMQNKHFSYPLNALKIRS